MGCWIAPRGRGGRQQDRAISTIAVARARCGGCGSPAPELAELLALAGVDGVGGSCKRLGMGKLGRLGLEPAVRYEREAAGRADPHRRQEAGPHRKAAPASASRGRQRPIQPPAAPTPKGDAATACGWDSVHVAIDDATRLAYTEVLPDEKATTAVGFLRRAIAFYCTATASPSNALITDNGSRLPSRDPRCRLPRPGHPPPAHPAPTAHRPTAKPSASSARCSTAGPTARSTPQAEKAPQPLTAGCGTTTIAADTQPSGDQTPITRLNNLLGTYS